jgi:hypothetical protein
MAAPPRSPRARWRRLAAVVVLVALVPVIVEAQRVLLGSNFHTVLDGRVYRCSQPTPEMLDKLIAEYGIRTVVNLRGTSDPLPWYLDEVRATHKYNICQEDIRFSANRLPPVPEVARLVEVLQRTEYPILLHCRRGADRTGLASAVVMLLQPGSRLEDGRHQLGCRFGHVAVGRPAQLDRFLDFYEDWLRANGKPHSAETFRDWALHHYVAGSCRCDLTLLDGPARVAVGEPLVFRVRARNTSLLPWTFKPQWTAGVHIGCRLFDEVDRQVDEVRSGLRDAEIPPGGTVDLTVALTPRYCPGRYRVFLDLVDEQQGWFYQAGSQPLEVELLVHE